jgi:hypothetical protein
VADKHDVNVLLRARHNGRGVDLQQKRERGGARERGSECTRITLQKTPL